MTRAAAWITLGATITLAYVIVAYRCYVNEHYTGYIYHPATQRLFFIDLKRPFDRRDLWKPLVPSLVRPMTLLDGSSITGTMNLANAIREQCDADAAAARLDRAIAQLERGEIPTLVDFTYCVRDDIEPASLLPEVWKPLQTLSQFWEREVLPVDLVITEWPNNTAVSAPAEEMRRELSGDATIVIDGQPIQIVGRRRTPWAAALPPRTESVSEALFIRGGPSLQVLEEWGLDLRLCGVMSVNASGPFVRSSPDVSDAR